jgi:hypothetical protein
MVALLMNRPDSFELLSRTFLDFSADITDKVLMGSIRSALRSLHGTVGGNVSFTLLQHKQGTAVIKTSAR